MCCIDGYLFDYTYHKMNSWLFLVVSLFASAIVLIVILRLDAIESPWTRLEE